MKGLNILFWKCILGGISLILIGILLIPSHAFIVGCFLGAGSGLITTSLFYKIIWGF